MSNNRANAVAPQRVDALARKLDDELLVYDAATHRGHCLNQTAAAVWKACDGKTTVHEIVRNLQEAAPGPGINEEIVRMALAKLENAGLLLKSASLSKESRPWSRRKALRRMGIAAAVALPAVTSLAVPTAAQAVSCFQLGHPCNNNAQCCSGHCGVLGVNVVCLP